MSEIGIILIRNVDEITSPGRRTDLGRICLISEAEYCAEWQKCKNAGISVICADLCSRPTGDIVIVCLEAFWDNKDLRKEDRTIFLLPRH